MEPRFLTGPAFMILGVIFLWMTARLWLVHPINRVFRLGRYVTEEGMAALLRLRPIFLSYGLLGLASGATRSVYWFAEQRVNAPVVMFLGSLEAGLAAWAAVLTVGGVLRLWRAG